MTQSRIPSVLFIQCKKTEVSGTYKIIHGEEWQGMPLWDQDTPRKQRIYSDTEGRWLIGTEASMVNNEGWVMSRDHQGRMPHEVCSHFLF